jgi:TM2 domain-containing membrane protein YozV
MGQAARRAIGGPLLDDAEPDVYDIRRVMAAKTRLDLDRDREDIEWVDDRDLSELESKSRLGAAVLGFFTWGGGRLYVGDVGKGIAAIGALVGWVALAALLPEVLGPLVYVAGGTIGALWSHDGARRVNRFVSTRSELQLREGAGPSGYRLLASAATVDPSLASALPTFGVTAGGPHSATVERLRKLAALHHAGVINDAELRERKVDIMTELGATNPDVDELLYSLLPLRNEGVLQAEDFEFLKQVTAR